MESRMGPNYASITNNRDLVMPIQDFFSIAISNFFKNIRIFFKYNLEKDAVQQSYLHEKIADLEANLLLTRKEFVELYFTLNKEDANNYGSELNYIKDTNGISAFPYRQIKTCNIPKYGFDAEKKLPFVTHNNKKLFFPSNWTPELACEKYRYYIEKENLLGGGFTEKAPHQYITDSFHVEQGDIVVDAGCAEALFALDSVEKAKHVYLLEADAIWLKPLQATFAPYKDKVTIIQKILSGEKSENAITLDSLFDKFSEESFFVKMDIEGAEESVIQGSKDFLTSQNKIKLACCTYHRANHAESISLLLKKFGYNFVFSDGFMLFPWDSHQQPPYFRRGLIRAKNFI